MKKIISLTLISSVAIILMTGCGGSSASPHEIDASVSEHAIYTHTHKHEKIAKAIKKAGEASGWTITEFKINAMIAEKAVGETTYATTLKLAHDYIDFENAEGTSDGDLDDLKNAIEEELNKEKNEH